MRTAKVFANGRSRAVRIPRDWLGDADEVELQRKGDSVILRPLHPSLGKIAERFRKKPLTIERVPQGMTTPKILGE